MKTTIKPTRNNILIKNPIKPMSTTIQVTEAVKKSYIEEQMLSAEKAEIIAAGPACVEVKVGDIVRIKTSRFMSADPMEGGEFLMINEGDVIAIY